MTDAEKKIRLIQADPGETGDRGRRLNLGSGDTPLEGWENLDRKTGDEVFPLPVPDAVAAEVRASHVLEHFPYEQCQQVLRDWVRVLEPGGMLKVAVPDFEKIARAYLRGEPIPVQGYVMGGHTDASDHHQAIFDAESLTDELRAAGLRDIRPWTSEAQDCAALPISLNLCGRKPKASQEQIMERGRRTHAVMSVPRLGFMDNFYSAMKGLVPFRIEMTKVSGAYWGQCLERGIKLAMQKGAEYIITVDYDTVYDARDVAELLALSLEHPEADAIVPIQVHRQRPTALMTVLGDDGQNRREVPMDFFEPELSPIATGHFGLTLLKVAALEEVGRPWFWSRPSPGGEWNDDRVDDDIWFWRQWAEFDKTLFLANHITVGHAELMIRWPDKKMVARYQHPTEFWTSGRPDWVWR